MDNVMFVITMDNIITVWAPINSWEPHILYQRASIPMNTPETHGIIPSYPSFCILVDSAELTRVLETVFNRVNSDDITNSDHLVQFADIARKSPEVCLLLDQNDDSLRVWGIDVSRFNRHSDFSAN